MVQTLLGNIGVAGGGVDALRGWHNVQGATDHGFLHAVYPRVSWSAASYIRLHYFGCGTIGFASGTCNQHLSQEATALAMDPDAPTAPQSPNWWGGTLFGTQYNRARYMVSLLKAWWPMCKIRITASQYYLPKRTGDCSFLTIFNEMGKVAKLNIPLKASFVGHKPDGNGA